MDYADASTVYDVLKFLRYELGILGKNIEKCSTIFYFKPENIKNNWEFLRKEMIRIDNVETCLHILSTDSTELERTYRYILSNYGEKYLNTNTSILGVNVERIKKWKKN